VPILPRKKVAEPIVVAVVPDKPKGATTPKKGKPTPKRATAQAARRQPIVQSATKTPQTKEEKAAVKEKERSVRNESYEGMKRGEEKHLSSRDKGPQRRYVRQFVDARWNIGEFIMLPSIALIAVLYLTLYFQIPALAGLLTIVVYGVVIATVIDLIVMWYRLKSQLTAKFGSIEPGTMMYAVTRAIQFRRMRIPNPQYKTHGNFPS
jgi:hypothetical protein